jgi:c-di-GMP-binding flagellar brake protein YcgR
MQSTLSTASQPLKVWEKMEIRVGDGPDAGRYFARIQDFINGGIVITDPEFVGGSTLLREDVQVTVAITREDAVYQFHSHVRRLTNHVKRQFILTPPRRMERVQRRLFVRVEMSRDISWAKIPQNIVWSSFESQLTWHQSRTVDVSGGGVQMKLDEHLENGDLCVLRVPFFRELGLPEMLASVVRRSFQRHGERFAGLEFIGTESIPRYFKSQDVSRLPESFLKFNRNAQNKLVTHLFNAQIELRRKGLL